MEMRKEIHVEKCGCADKKKLVIEEFEKITPGQSFVLVNSVDPRPLIEFFERQYHNQFSYKYMDKLENEFRVIFYKNKTSCCGFCE